MIWNEEISFDGFQKKIDEWYKDKDFELCNPPISAQFALYLIFKTLVDDREDYPYLTTMPESIEQTNSIMLDLILRKYSRKYRKYLKLKKKNIAKIIIVIVLVIGLFFGYKNSPKMLSFLTVFVGILFVFLVANNIYRLEEFFWFLDKNYR